MLKHGIIVLLVFLGSYTQSQITLFSEDFESGLDLGNPAGSLSPNFWITNTCAGNGPSYPGIYSLYITQSGPDPGCGPTGAIQYAYANAVSGSAETIRYASVDGTCAENLNLSFDYKIDGASAEDFMEIIYSTDGGTTWNVLLNLPELSGGWQTQTVSLPALLNYSIFDIGIRFRYDASGINGSPGAIDNILITGMDVLAPMVTCPTSYTTPTDASCSYLMPDLSSLVVMNDNCTNPGFFGLLQSPAVNDPVSGSTSATIIVNDQSGNTNTCIIEVIPDDVIAPIITCPNPAPVDNGVACQYILPDYGSLALINDNCPDYLITQNPPVSSVVEAGNNTIQLTVTDAAGNTAQCDFTLFVFENEQPTIICPSNITTCDPQVLYLDPLFNDNCQVVLTQTDMSGYTSGSVFPIGITNQTYEVADASGNTQSCSFSIEVLEYPAIADIPEDTLLVCEVNSTIIFAELPSSGTGSWSVSSGNGVFNNPSANTTGVNNINFGTNVFVWTVNTVACGFTSDSLVVIRNQQDLPANTVDTSYACTSQTVSLSANTPLYGTGTWTSLSGSTISDIHAAASEAEGLINGWQSFVWTISNGACQLTTDTLHVFAVLDPQIEQGDTLLCLENNILFLSATEPNDGQIPAWYTISGSAQILNPSSFTTQAENFIVGNTKIVYHLNHTVCASVSDTILISGSVCEGFQPVIPTVMTPGNFDGKNDLFSIDFLHALYPECDVFIFNRWGSQVFESKGYEIPWDGTYSGQPLPAGTYFYKIELNDPDGTVYNGSISIIR